MLEPLFARALNSTRLRVLDVDAALWKLRGRLHRMRTRPWPLFVVLALTLGACGGVERHARTALDVSAHALVATDSAVAVVYEDRAEEALQAATSLEDYRARMETLDRTEAALRVARGSLLAAESALDAGEADDALGVIGCVGDALGTLASALAEIDVAVPRKVRDALDLVRAVAGDRCEVTP